MQFSQRDYLPTITEGQSASVGITAPSLKLPVPSEYQSHNGDWCIDGDTIDKQRNLLKTTSLDNVHMPSPTTTISSPISDLNLLPGATNPTERLTRDTPPPSKASPPSLEDQHLRQLEWATRKILAQPERASMVYRRMRRKNMVRQLSFLDDLTQKHSCQSCGMTFSLYDTHDCQV